MRKFFFEVLLFLQNVAWKAETGNIKKKLDDVFGTNSFINGFFKAFSVLNSGFFCEAFHEIKRCFDESTVFKNSHTEFFWNICDIDFAFNFEVHDTVPLSSGYGYYNNAKWLPSQQMETIFRYLD